MDKSQNWKKLRDRPLIVSWISNVKWSESRSRQQYFDIVNVFKVGAWYAYRAKVASDNLSHEYVQESLQSAPTTKQKALRVAIDYMRENK